MRLTQHVAALAHEDLQRGRWGVTSGASGRTGRLANSIFAQIVMDNRAEIGAGSNVVYAAIHEFGGEIRAKNAPYLHFQTRGGQWVKTKKVTIPGRFYIRSTINDFFRSGSDQDIANGAFREHKRRYGFD